MSQVNPQQNVSPTSTVHFDANNKVVGAGRSLDGGCPLLLSLASAIAAQLATISDNDDYCATRAFELASQLIERYNKEASRAP